MSSLALRGIHLPLFNTARTSIQGPNIRLAAEVDPRPSISLNKDYEGNRWKGRASAEEATPKLSETHNQAARPTWPMLPPPINPIQKKHELQPGHVSSILQSVVRFAFRARGYESADQQIQVWRSSFCKTHAPATDQEGAIQGRPCQRIRK